MTKKKEGKTVECDASERKVLILSGIHPSRIIRVECLHKK